ncbi:MAG: hypothetical protein ACF8PN_06555 [Phycisphaerales bacterium]
MTDGTIADQPRLDQPDGLPRGLLLWWSLWLLAAWFQAFVWDQPTAPSPSFLTLAPQQMLFSIGLGMTIVWPVFRFTRRPQRRDSARLPFYDWVAIAGTAQVVIWPMRLWTDWPPSRILMVDLTLLGWALLIGGAIAWGIAGPEPTRAIRQLLALLGCIIIAGAAPLIALTLNGGTAGSAPSEWMHWSPLTRLWLLGQRAPTPPPTIDWIRAGVVVFIAVLVWLAAALLPRRESPRPIPTKG